MKQFSIKGQVISAQTRQPLSGLRVEAWDKDLIIDDLLGSAVTNADGRFVIEFDQRYFTELIFDRRPDVFFRVFRENRMVADTSGRVLWNISRQTADIVIEANESGRGGGNGGDAGGGNGAFEVRGIVADDRGVAVRGVGVEAHDHNLNGATLLGAATTNTSGRYSILYRPPSGKARADLQVRTQAIDSEVRYDAEPLEIIDLVVPMENLSRGTEYERLQAAIRPHLGTATLGALSAESVNYVANQKPMGSAHRGHGSPGRASGGIDAASGSALLCAVSRGRIRRRNRVESSLDRLCRADTPQGGRKQAHSRRCQHRGNCNQAPRTQRAAYSVRQAGRRRLHSG
jgi:hypothetical protein